MLSPCHCDQIFHNVKKGQNWIFPKTFVSVPMDVITFDLCSLNEPKARFGQYRIKVSYKGDIEPYSSPLNLHF